MYVSVKAPLFILKQCFKRFKIMFVYDVCNGTLDYELNRGHCYKA